MTRTDITKQKNKKIYKIVENLPTIYRHHQKQGGFAHPGNTVQPFGIVVDILDRCVEIGRVGRFFLYLVS